MSVQYSSHYSVPQESFIKTNMDMPYNVPMSYQVTPPIFPQKSTFSIFGPLTKEYCIWFYLLSVVGFVLLVLLLVSGLFIGLSKGKNTEYYYYLLMGSLAYGIFYFQNRLLYSMCIKSL
jgi:hypothetical protein